MLFKKDYFQCHKPGDITAIASDERDTFSLIFLSKNPEDMHQSLSPFLSSTFISFMALYLCYAKVNDVALLMGMYVDCTQ